MRGVLDQLQASRQHCLKVSKSEVYGLMYITKLKSLCQIIGSKFPLDNGMIHVFDLAILYLSPFLVGSVQTKG